VYDPGFFEYKLKMMSKYYFTIAFENSNAVGYVTEKVWHALAVGSIPSMLLSVLFILTNMNTSLHGGS
jgi:Glycosyltransferase family 10 (fucosyltransferase) C-term